MLRRMLLPTAITAGLVLIACETPRPEPIGPSLAQGEQERRAGVITEVPVGRIALARRLSAEDCEPKTIDGKEWVLAACVALRDSASEPHYHYNASSSRSRGSLAPLADSLKRLLDTTERVLRSELEREAVRRALRRPPTSALQPREIELPKSPAAPLGPLAGQEPEAVEVPARIRGAPSLGAQREIVESSAGQLVVRKPLSGPTSTDPITVVVLSSAGRELARERSKAGAGSTALERLDPEDIAAIEVTKSSGNCGDCPRITVTLKAGVTFRT